MHYKNLQTESTFAESNLQKRYANNATEHDLLKDYRSHVHRQLTSENTSKLFSHTKIQIPSHNSNKISYCKQIARDVYQTV